MKNPEESGKPWGAVRNSDRGEGTPGCEKSGAMGHGGNFKGGALVNPAQVQMLRWHSQEGTLRKLFRRGQGAGGQIHLEAERNYQIWRERRLGKPMLGQLTGRLSGICGPVGQGSSYRTGTERTQQVSS